MASFVLVTIYSALHALVQCYARFILRREQIKAETISVYSRNVLAFSYSNPGFDPTVVFCYGVYSVASIYYQILFYSETRSV